MIIFKQVEEGISISINGQEAVLDPATIRILRDHISIYGEATSTHPFKVGDKVRFSCHGADETDEDYFMDRAEVVTQTRSRRWKEGWSKTHLFDEHQLSTLPITSPCPEPWDDAGMYVATGAQEALKLVSE